MTYPAYKGSGQLGSVHLAAIREEIGERFWLKQDREPVHLPPHLFELMERLRDDCSSNSPDSVA
jgi:hypothetical protein